MLELLIWAHKCLGGWFLPCMFRDQPNKWITISWTLRGQKSIQIKPMWWIYILGGANTIDYRPCYHLYTIVTETQLW